MEAPWRKTKSFYRLLRNSPFGIQCVKYFYSLGIRHAAFVQTQFAQGVCGPKSHPDISFICRTVECGTSSYNCGIIKVHFAAVWFTRKGVDHWVGSQLCWNNKCRSLIRPPPICDSAAICSHKGSPTVEWMAIIRRIVQLSNDDQCRTNIALSRHGTRNAICVLVRAVNVDIQARCRNGRERVRPMAGFAFTYRQALPE